MDHKTVGIWIIIVMMASGCTSIMNTINMIPPWRTHGVKQLDGHQEVWKEYNCQSEELPLIKIEHNELVPKRLNPKKKMECNHRFVYGLCYQQHSKEIVGILHTRIFHGGKMIVNDVENNYLLKPGRWRVDTFIIVPEDVESGVYTLETEFTSPDTGIFKHDIGFKMNNTFIVE
jgi:hypothetical protein